MIIISSRKDFIDCDNLNSEGHVIREIDLNTDKKINEYDLSGLLVKIRNKKVCILVHGYNNEFFEVCDSYQIMESNIAEYLDGTYDMVIGYTWPGGNQKLEWWDAKSRANAVARMFRQLLDSLSSETIQIDLISHSLGARVCLKALKDASKQLVENYYCMAGAVDNESLELDEEFHPSLKNIKKLFVLHSARDEVLAFAYQAAELDNAIGLFGPEDFRSIIDFNIYVANCKKVVANHGGYKRSRAVFDYIKLTCNSEHPDKFLTLK